MDNDLDYILVRHYLSMLVKDPERFSAFVVELIKVYSCNDEDDVGKLLDSASRILIKNEET